MDARQAQMLREIDPGVLGARIRAARLAAGKRQGDLGGDDVTISYVSRIEAGQRKPDARVLQIIADRLALPVEELLVGPGHASAHQQLEVDYAEIALEMGDAGAARGRLLTVIEAGATVEPALLRRARYLLARADEGLGQLEPAIEQLESLLADEPDGTVAVTGGIALCRCYRELGDNQRAIAAGERLTAQVEAWGLQDSDEAIQLVLTLAAAYFEQGDVHHAIRLCRAAGESAERVGSPRGRASAYWNASVIEMQRGDLVSAVSLAGRAIAMLGEGSDQRNLGRLKSQLGIMQLLLDPPELDEAELNLTSAAAILASTSASEVDVLRNEVGLARSQFLRGEFMAAEQMAAAAFKASAGKLPLLAADARALQGEAAAALGDVEAARVAYRDAVHALTAAGADRRAAQIWLDLGALLEAIGDLEASRDAYRSAAVSSGLRPAGLRTSLDRTTGTN